MVTSYQGATIQKVKDTNVQSIQVSGWMSTRLITFHPDQSIFEVIDKLLTHRISGGPVVDDSGNLVGVISEGDCLKELIRGKYNNTPNLSGKVSDHMATNVITIGPHVNIFEAAQKFLNLRLRRLPVIEYGKLIGQISQKDIMKAVQSMRSSTW
ncbi:MAG: CBS domain-containing protein [Bacteroidetes bacterium]|nr:CBS domain-containing protein [Bacteroidota bacterium]MDA1122400.1 CBS domain-containing protein [Bacteroidota bacterium]